MKRRPETLSIEELREGPGRKPKKVAASSSGEPPRRKYKEKFREGRIKYLTTEEITSLFAKIRKPRDRAMFRLMYHGGLRASEIAVVQIRDYNPKTRKLYIDRLKGSNAGEHTLCKIEELALRRWLEIRGTEPGPIFLSNRKKAIDRRTIWQLMGRYGRLAGLPDRLCHPHSLKHSCCTHLLEKGFGIEQVQDWVGHAAIQSTSVYAKITNRRRDQMAHDLRHWR